MSKLTFGKYKDEDICDIPINYLKWLEEQPWIDKFIGMRQEINHEIERREGNRPGKGFVKSKLNIKTKENL